MGNERKRGLEGEEIACRHLERAGYGIVARNYSSRYGEVDIVAQHGDVLVFVEVKRYKPKSVVHPLLAVTEQKQEKIRKTALCFLAENHENEERAIRFDVVVVGNALVQQHLLNAFH